MAGNVFKRLTGMFSRRVSPSSTIGAPGSTIYGGYVTEFERDKTLTSREKYRVYSEALANVAIVGAGVRFLQNLIGAAQWTFTPSEADVDGSYAKLAEEMIMDDPERSWSRIVKRASTFIFYGFSIQEWRARKREDGVITLADVSPRPQITIERWDREGDEILGVTQRIQQSSKEAYIPRSKFVYTCDDTLSDSPEGLGLFRHLVDAVRRLKIYEQLEGIGFQNDLRGIPVARAPYGELKELEIQRPDLKDAIKEATENVENFIQNHKKDKVTGVVLDSMVHSTMDDSQAGRHRHINMT